MILTKKQIADFEEAAKPLIKFLNENCHPHTSVLVDLTSAEISTSSARIICDEFIKD